MINFAYKLLQELSNDVRIRTLGHQETIGKSQDWVRTQPSVSSPLHKSISFKNGKKVVKFLFYLILLYFFILYHIFFQRLKADPIKKY